MRNIRTDVFIVLARDGKILFRKKGSDVFLPGGELRGGLGWREAVEGHLGQKVDRFFLTGLYSDCPGVAACFLVESKSDVTGSWEEPGKPKLSSFERTMLDDALKFSGAPFVR